MENNTKLWHVVKFDDGQVGIVAEPWLLQDRKSCRFPASNKFNLAKITEACSSPKDSWPVYSIIKFYKRNLRTLNEAKDELIDIDSEMSDCPSQPPQSVNKQLDPLPSFPGTVLSNSDGAPPAIGESEEILVTPDLPVPRRKKASAADKAGQVRVRPLASLTSYSPEIHGEASGLAISQPSMVANNEPVTEKNQPVVMDTRSAVNNDAAITNNQPNDQSAPATNNSASNQTNQPVQQVANNRQVVENNPDADLDAFLQGGAVQVPSSLLRGLVRSTVNTNRYLRTLESRQSTPNRSNENVDQRAAAYAEMENGILSGCPITDVRAFAKLDKKLSKSKSARDKIRAELELLKTDDAKSSCQAMLAKIMSDRVAQHYSFEGRPNSRSPGGVKKKPFKETKTHTIIYQVCNFLFPHAKLTAATYKVALRGWLSQAKFRLLRRQERAARRLQEGTESNEDHNSESSLSEPDSDLDDQ